MSDSRSSDEKERRHGDALAEEFAVRFQDALEQGDALSAESIATEALQANLEVEEIYDKVIGPSLIRIGHMWQEGTASVADEHLATAISQQVMASLFPRMLRNSSHERHKVMLGGPEGEHHVVGLRMIADTLEGAGYEVLFLGPNVPNESLLDACRRHNPTALGLTAAMPSGVPALVDVIKAVLELEEPPAIFVGGRAMASVRELGVDIPVARTCEEVVEFVASLVDNPVSPEDVRGYIKSGRKAWEENLSGLSEVEAEARLNTGDLNLASAFSTNSELAAANARAAARDAFNTKELAYRDGLTGLWNRRAYDDRLREMTDGRSRGAVLMLDVDRFKGVNDNFGHEAGDQALIGVGRAILHSIRPADFGARYGGDEFMVLMPGMDLAAATEVAERIRSTIKKELRDPPVTVSIGASTLDKDPRASSLAIDQALYGAKRAGRDRVVST